MAMKTVGRNILAVIAGVVVGSLEEGVAAILEADFLTDQQKRDILCNNAARFLRLGEEVCS